MPGDGKNPDQWTPENKLAVIIETAALNQAELAAYCRKKGLFAEQIQQWKEAFVDGVSDHSTNRWFQAHYRPSTYACVDKAGGMSRSLNACA